MSVVFSLAAATNLQLPDGTWYSVAPGSLTVVIDPAFTDAGGNLVTPGAQWVQWTDGGGQAYAAPFPAVVALKFPVTIAPPPSTGGGSGGGGP